MSQDKPETLLERCRETTPHDLRNMMRLLATFVGWAVCFVGSSQLIKRGLLPAGATSWVVAALPTVTGIFVLVAYARYLREADELMRLIQLQALALGFGGSFFALAGYLVFERLGAPALDLGDSSLVMAGFYSIGTLLGRWQYR